MDALTYPVDGESAWGNDIRANFLAIEQALKGLQPIGPLDVVAGSTFPDYYTKDEVNEIIAGANFSFFLSDTVDAVIGAYFQLFDADTGGIKSSVGPITIAADGTTIKTFITEIGQPTFTVLSEGVLSLDIHALTTVGANTKAAQVQWELWKRTQPGGVETLLVTSEEGPNLTDTETHYTIHGILTEEINLDATDRLVLKVLGNNSGTQPNDPDVTISMEGDTASRVSVQTTISAFDQRYLQLNSALPMIADLDMGGHDLVNLGNPLGMNYVDRGDPGAPDFLVGDFTTNGNWHDLDLSAIVPANAVAVHFLIHLSDNLTAQWFLFRKKGNANSWNANYIYTQVANITMAADQICTCDANRVIQYAAINTAWTDITFVVRGWWISA